MPRTTRESRSSRAGIYKVTYSVSGVEPSQMALFLNGAKVDGSVYGSGAGTQPLIGQVIIQVRRRRRADAPQPQRRRGSHPPDARGRHPGKRKRLYRNRKAWLTHDP